MSAPTASILDDFNRANENPIAGNWSNKIDSPHANMQISSNKLISTIPTGTASAWWNQRDWGPDCEAVFTMQTKASNSHGCFIHLRMKDTGGTSIWDSYRFGVTTQAGTDTWSIQRIDNATVGATLASGSQEFSNGDKIGAQIIGDTMVLWWFNGTTWTVLGTAVDSTYMAAGKIGIDVNDSTVAIDDFAAQTLSVNLALTPSGSEFRGIEYKDPGTRLIDDFNRANENPLSFGGQWSRNGAAGGGQRMQVSSNQVGLTANGGVGAYWNVEQYGQDQEAYLTITTLPASGDLIGVLLNLAGPANSDSWSGYFVSYDAGTPNTVNVKLVNAGLVTSTPLTVNVTFNAGDKLLARNYQGVISVFRYDLTNSVWVFLGSVADTTYQRTGFIGMRGLDTVFRIDDFGGGAIQEARLTLTPSGSETPGLGSGGTENLVLTPSVVEFMLADEGTEAFALTPTGADIQDIHDGNTEYITLLPIGADDPQYPLVEAGVERLALVASGTDLLAKQYTESATELFKFRIDSHECYAIQPSEYSVSLSKRWNMQNPFARWEMGSLTNRWSTFVVGVGFEIPC